MGDIKDYIRNLPGWLIVVLSVPLVVILGFADAMTPTEVTFTPLYLIPICLVSWYAGRTWGFCMAFFAIATRVVSDRVLITDFQNKEAIIWNAIIAVTVFPVVVYLVAALKAASNQLERRVQKRTADLIAEIGERQRAEDILRKLAAQLSAAEDAERRRLATDIHDSVGQSLSLLKMNLERMSTNANGNGTSPNGITDSLTLLNDVIKQTRSLTFDLYPAMLDDLGLVPTLSWYGEQLGKQTGVQVSVSEVGTPQPLPSSLANYLFRACKELFNNANKHGNAREIFVAVHWQPSVLRIVIDDDGCGFEPVEVLVSRAGQGLGLPGIRERLTSLGGQLFIESEKGQGARVILQVSLVPAEWMNVVPT